LPTGGFRVREFAIDDIWDAIEIRGVLEGTAARLAAERLSDPGELAKLRLCCEEQKRVLPTELQEFVRYFELNDVFHTGLWRLAKSPMLERTLESVVALPFAAPSALLFSPADPEERRTVALIAIDQHRSIVEAIEKGRGREPRASHASTPGLPGGILWMHFRMVSCSGACRALLSSECLLRPSRMASERIRFTVRGSGKPTHVCDHRPKQHGAHRYHRVENSR
jgi:hypothetical protein